MYCTGLAGYIYVTGENKKSRFRIPTLGRFRKYFVLEISKSLFKNLKKKKKRGSSLFPKFWPEIICYLFNFCCTLSANQIKIHNYT